MKKKEKIKNTFNILRIEKSTQMQYIKRTRNRYSILLYLLRILNVFFIFSFFIVLDSSKNFQQKFANYTYYFPYFLTINLLLKDNCDFMCTSICIFTYNHCYETDFSHLILTNGG